MAKERDYFVYVHDEHRCQLRAVPYRNGMKMPKAAKDKGRVVVRGTSKLDAELTAHNELCKPRPHVQRW